MSYGKLRPGNRLDRVQIPGFACCFPKVIHNFFHIGALASEIFIFQLKQPAEDGNFALQNPVKSPASGGALRFPFFTGLNELERAAVLPGEVPPAWELP